MSIKSENETNGKGGDQKNKKKKALVVNENQKQQEVLENSNEKEEDLKRMADEAFANPELLKKFEDLMEGCKDAEYLEGANSNDVLPGVNLGVIQLNRCASSSMHLFTLNVIRVGEVLVFLKKLVRREGHNWGIYSKNNIENISERTLQKWMVLAKCKVSVKYAHLGVERLCYVIQARKGVKESDPIGPFLEKHQIQCNPEADFELSVAEFKAAVDVALVLERAEQEKVNLDPEKVKRTVSAIGRFNDEDWDRINFIKFTGGDANVFLEKAHANGASPTFSKKKKGGKNPKPFSKIASDLKEYTTLAKAEEEIVDKLDLKQIDSIIEELQELRNLIVTV